MGIVGQGGCAHRLNKSLVIPIVGRLGTEVGAQYPIEHGWKQVGPISFDHRKHQGCRCQNHAEKQISRWHVAQIAQKPRWSCCGTIGRWLQRMEGIRGMVWCAIGVSLYPQIVNVIGDGVGQQRHFLVLVAGKLRGKWLLPL